MTDISRRDFLRFLAALSAGGALSGILPAHPVLSTAAQAKPNIILLLFDAMSAKNLSVYGYPRRTTPNLERLAQRATVFHNHYSGGNYTTPGTASLLTGMVPWTHRAINEGGLVRRNLAGHNVFALMGNEYLRAAYTQNIWADMFLWQYKKAIQEHLSMSTFRDADKFLNPFLDQTAIPDSALLYHAVDQFLTLGAVHPWPGSLSLGYLNYLHIATRTGLDSPTDEYPYGRPNNVYYFYDNATVLAGISKTIQTLASQPSPFLAYFHVWTPHEPLRPRKEFVNIFPPVEIIDKPHHPLSTTSRSPGDYAPLIDQYDEYIADVDSEFGKLLDQLERSGVLENSYVIVTADHGQLFERGVEYHTTPLLYDPVIRIPLIISEPGSGFHRDIHTNTSAVDVLPTLLSLANKDLPAGLEGRLLPGLGGPEDGTRSIFAVEAKENSAFAPLTKATIAMIKGNRKMIYYTGYKGAYRNQFELYDLSNDPEELRNLFKKDPSTAGPMQDELLSTLQSANRPYE